MADMQVEEVWRRAKVHGPRVVSASLIVLIALESVRMFTAIFGADPAFGSSSAVAPDRALRVPQVNVGRIVAAHLFGVAPPAAAEEDPANAVPSTGNLVLAGTLATPDPGRGMAIIENAGLPSVFSVGEPLDGATLHQVYRDHVILKRDGVLQSLTMPLGLLAKAMPLPAANPPETAAASASTEPAAAAPDPSLIHEIARTSPMQDGSGKFVGIRVFPGSDKSAFWGSGLKGGDVVLAVNGRPLDDPQRGSQIWNGIATGALVTVQRRGKAQDITLNLAP